MPSPHPPIYNNTIREMDTARDRLVLTFLTFLLLLLPIFLFARM